MKSYGKPKRLKRRGKLTKNYYVRVFDRVTKRDTWKTTGCKNRRAAEEWVRTKEVEQALGPERLRARKRDEIGFTTVYEEWLASKIGNVTDKHVLDLKRRGDRFWKAYFGKHALREIEPCHVRDYLARRATGIVPGARTLRKLTGTTLNNDLNGLKSLFNFATDQGYLDRSPAQPVKPSRQEMKRRVRTLTEDDEERLLKACRQPRRPDYLYPVVLVALRCGFRRRTIFALRWEHADLEARRWRIPGGLMKSKRDYEAPIPLSVVNMLRQYREEIAERHGSARTTSRSPVFGLQADSVISRSFQRAVRAAGLNDMTFHDLRRIYLNYLRDKGVPIDVAMALTAHRSLSTVMKHYREVPSSELDKAVKAIDSGVSSPASAGSPSSPFEQK